MGVNINNKKPSVKNTNLNTKNPFNKGVSYDAFLLNVKGNVTVDSLLNKLNLQKDQLNWIKSELENHKNNKK